MARTAVDEKVAALSDLTRPELMALWQKRYSCPPPLGVRQPLLVRAAAWHLQERALGGLSINAKRLLKAALKAADVQTATGSKAASAEAVSTAVDMPDSDLAPDQQHPIAQSEDRPAAIRLIPLPGARLIREWNGKRHTVDAVQGGYLMEGKQYRSLTAIAFAITGARWSGPRFFGL